MAYFYNSHCISTGQRCSGVLLFRRKFNLRTEVFSKAGSVISQPEMNPGSTIWAV